MAGVMMGEGDGGADVASTMELKERPGRLSGCAVCLVYHGIGEGE